MSEDTVSEEEFQRVRKEYKEAKRQFAEKVEEKATKIGKWFNLQNMSLSPHDRLTESEIKEIAYVLAERIIPYPKAEVEAYIKLEVAREKDIEHREWEKKMNK